MEGRHTWYLFVLIRPTRGALAQRDDSQCSLQFKCRDAFSPVLRSTHTYPGLPGFPCAERVARENREERASGRGAGARARVRRVRTGIPRQGAASE
ncbi:hypothetical protein B0T11DRAFT_132597 [Plectosphaerella cucumerina]|uniref:Uncharacterized protein n=1 Tax=Plectosphaerella cucumerina TaxID=40658 RepID=A0A8K0T5V1_9PEZI|nr:hypothetical protein B0T11DRAFT_132597 [Plectosphaerella cucumerina]